MEKSKLETIGESEIMYLYEVIIARQDHEDKLKWKDTSEFYVASDIKDVWEKIQIELLDQAVEVKTINRSVPILAILKRNNA